MDTNVFSVFISLPTVNWIKIILMESKIGVAHGVRKFVGLTSEEIIVRKDIYELIDWNNKDFKTLL